MKKINSKKGITIISLIITIILILILTGVTVTSTYTGSDLRRYKLMCADVETLEDKVLYFYRQYGELPIGNEVFNLKSEIDNGHAFYEINVNKLDNITLNYGDEEDIFIIDSVTFEVYYLNGIEYQDEIYYTDIEEETSVEENRVLLYSQTAKDLNGLLKAKARYISGEYTAVIPKGFKIIEGVDGNISIEDGLVIQDAKGNEFVWVPVKDFNKFTRENGYYNNSRQTCVFTSVGLTTGEYYEPQGDGITVDTTASEEIQEAQKIYKSVKENQGFYIGRYEMGFEGSSAKETYTSYPEKPTQEVINSEVEKLVVKSNVLVYNHVPWGASMTDTTAVNKGTEDTPKYVIGAVELSRNFDSVNNYTGVTSTLCYGVQWDAVMKWMEDVPNPNILGKKYIENSTNMGWYSDNYSSGNADNKTGMAVDDMVSNCVKNIYDLAGNFYEWTMEANGTDYRTQRGGYYKRTGIYPASYRNNTQAPSKTFAERGFRIALFLS